jgi:hypothetical protein
VAKRIGPNLRQPLNDFARKTRDAFEPEPVGYATTFVAAKALDLGLLSPQVADVFGSGLHTLDVETRLSKGELEFEPGFDKRVKSNLRLPEKLRRHHARS